MISFDLFAFLLLGFPKGLATFQLNLSSPILDKIIKKREYDLELEGWEYVNTFCIAQGNWEGFLQNFLEVDRRH